MGSKWNNLTLFQIEIVRSLYSHKSIVVSERKTAFGQKPKFAFGERVRLSWQPSFLPMPIGLWAAHTRGH